MPGIAGFISHIPMADARGTIDQMVSCMLHESFFKSGSLLQEDMGLCVGWACHPGSFADASPAWNDQRDVGLVFAGEHFADGANVNMRSLLQAYEARGESFLRELNGIFSGVLIDRRRSKVIVFNDRYGLGRLYVHEEEHGFLFASEAKALLKIKPALRQLDMQSFGEFFSCGCALENRTLFAGVNLLPGGSAWTFSPGQPVRRETYFDRGAWERQPKLSAEDYYERLNATFTRILPRYFRSGGKVGLSLTGGLDSRMILACGDLLPQAMPCYTFGGPYRDCADVRVARQLAQACGRPHQVIPVTREFFPEFPELARRTVYSTDGGLDVMGSVEVFVNRIARNIAPVRMTGNYGSEILRTNVAFKPMPLDEGIFSPEFAGHFKAAAKTYARLREEDSPTSFIAFKQVPWHHHARLAVEQSTLQPRSPYLDNELVALAYQAPRDLSLNKALAHRFIEAHNPAFVGIPTDRGVVGSKRANVGRLGAMRQEFLPKAEYAMDYGMPPWLARIDGVMRATRWERLFLGRQKFYHFRVWYRDQLSDYVKAVLLDPRTLRRSYLDAKRVERMVNAHTGGWGNHTLEIHKLLTSELIQGCLLENSSGAS
jgi:asparagine synthase (glutamine-hydrolysing)